MLSVLCSSTGTNIFAGTNGGVFLSTNNGTNWTAVNTGLTDTLIMSILLPSLAQISLPGLLVAVSFVPPTMAQAGLQSILDYRMLCSCSCRIRHKYLMPESIAAVYFFRQTTAQAGLRRIQLDEHLCLCLLLSQVRISLWGLL